MMDLESAIRHCEEVAKTNERICATELSVGLPDIYRHKDEAKKCANEHRQLAEWLKELKAYKENTCRDAISRKYILDLIATKGANLDDDLLIVEQWIQDAPSVNPHPIECGDAISRQAAKKALEDRFIELQKRHSENRYETNFCLNTILELPSVTPQQRTGRWIQKEEDGEAEPFIIWECSECHCVDEDGKPSYKYCPNCGAKMEVEDI